MSSSSATREPLQPGAGPNGWLAFASILLFLNGFFGAFWGLTAILNSDVITVGGKGVVIWDFTTWGWITLIVSVVMVLTSVGMVLGKSAARWLAVVFTTIHALVQFGSISAFPLWSILLISLDVVILYNLFVRWQLED
ncbi:MAG: hypothetical protein JHD16_17325 [Solirubrobacteraceae bacterium]|nr:hypothetical protein [Solirubrobacteraceae bacterium]